MDMLDWFQPEAIPSKSFDFTQPPRTQTPTAQFWRSTSRHQTVEPYEWLQISNMDLKWKMSTRQMAARRRWSVLPRPLMKIWSASCWIILYPLCLLCCVLQRRYMQQSLVRVAQTCTMFWLFLVVHRSQRCPPHLPVSFGFDTACKTYATLVGRRISPVFRWSGTLWHGLFTLLFDAFCVAVLVDADMLLTCSEDSKGMQNEAMSQSTHSVPRSAPIHESASMMILLVAQQAWLRCDCSYMRPQKRYYHLVRLMGRSASNIALEVVCCSALLEMDTASSNPFIFGGRLTLVDTVMQKRIQVVGVALVAVVSW